MSNFSRHDKEPVFRWIPAYAVNVPQIDREHQILFGIVESLNEAMRAGEGRQRLESLLAETVKYSRQHFSHEEALMRAAGFPELDSHKREHAELSSLIQAFQSRFQNGETTITIQLMQFLIHWLERHTTTCDLRFAAYLSSRSGVESYESPGRKS